MGLWWIRERSLVLAEGRECPSTSCLGSQEGLCSHALVLPACALEEKCAEIGYGQEGEIYRELLSYMRSAPLGQECRGWRRPWASACPGAQHHVGCTWDMAPPVPLVLCNHWFDLVAFSRAHTHSAVLFRKIISLLDIPQPGEMLWPPDKNPISHVYSCLTQICTGWCKNQWRSWKQAPAALYQTSCLVSVSTRTEFGCFHVGGEALMVEGDLGRYVVLIPSHGQ